MSYASALSGKPSAEKKYPHGIPASVSLYQMNFQVLEEDCASRQEYVDLSGNHIHRQFITIATSEEDARARILARFQVGEMRVETRTVELGGTSHTYQCNLWKGDVCDMLFPFSEGMGWVSNHKEICRKSILRSKIYKIDEDVILVSALDG
jgi:hypothetical protein